MLQDASPVIQALLGTLMTWGLTALGASVAVFVQGSQVDPLVLCFNARVIFYLALIGRFELRPPSSRKHLFRKESSLC